VTWSGLTQAVSGIAGPDIAGIVTTTARGIADDKDALRWVADGQD
jgi:hypothetical protein